MELNQIKTSQNENQAKLLLSSFCEKHNLLQLKNKMIRLPFLIKGQIKCPREINLQEIELAFTMLDQSQNVLKAKAHYLQLEDLQILRENVIDRKLLKETSEYIYTIMPIFKSEEVLEKDIEQLSKKLYNMDFSKVLEFTEAVRQLLEDEVDFVDEVCAATQKTSELPDFWHDAGFSMFSTLLNRETMTQMVDKDLSAWGLKGSELLNGWQSIKEAQVEAAPIHILMSLLFPENENHLSEKTPQIRALPTRQLHITAGNSPQIPLISLLRAIATKSPAVLKLPFGATAPGALIALAAAVILPDHPLTQHLSIVYWKGGDEQIESSFFKPNAFDRIVVWGAPDAVVSVKSRALFTKVLTFNPRYGVSFLGKEIFSNPTELKSAALKAVTDSLVANQKACIASQIHYVEGNKEQIKSYAEELQNILAQVDQAAPNYLKPNMKGEIKRLERGYFLNADWYTNKKENTYQSSVVVVEDEFNVSNHPMCRMIVVRPVTDLNQALQYLHHGVSTVSVYPPSKHQALRDQIAARGVSQVMQLGHSGIGYAGQCHDGMMVLTELVDWKNSV